MAGGQGTLCVVSTEMPMLMPMLLENDNAVKVILKDLCELNVSKYRKTGQSKCHLTPIPIACYKKFS